MHFSSMSIDVKKKTFNDQFYLFYLEIFGVCFVFLFTKKIGWRKISVLWYEFNTMSASPRPGQVQVTLYTCSDRVWNKWEVVRRGTLQLEGPVFVHSAWLKAWHVKLQRGHLVWDILKPSTKHFLYTSANRAQANLATCRSVGVLAIKHLFVCHTAYLTSHASGMCGFRSYLQMITIKPANKV